MTAPRVLVIACGALARELLAITELNGLVNVTVECLPASLHNRPKEIPELVRQRIHRARGKDDMLQDDMVPGTNSSTGASPPGDNQLLDAGTEPAAGTFDQILIGYADCGTGGLLDKVCAEENVEMLAGAHCYQFFATAPRFDELQDHALGSFYLTDFLARNWERLIWDGMGIAKHPELRDMYFGNYTRCVYLEQTDDPKARAAAHECADRLGLELHIEHTGYGELESTMVDFTRKATA
ncbi:MAG: DUF1638 domain-containing protein [Ilumatobacter sp.]|mgnify:CR=1 FL=1|jgi:hypothetical protein|uniref:DUF1638 domain-containing protein n=1 Tax=Ilumatobacter sp. TaxID=1967498 RepID=UPI001D84E8DF|nr:DUF1638 domain-containing protein [Ilumatobacter sp.]MBT5276817.1 DUF1638 domain-containing protein [Ilumatobacter sp.]MBT5552320.1 DUF1638 domain-containing protein [Ilumatobacter sp.]MBT5866399.1 DUF1638 domain-containing protein [Ilumatobacter sp.]MBT7430830.1 DUF1638 domain-containing protein [Ilumatobacter sp.]